MLTPLTPLTPQTLFLAVDAGAVLAVLLMIWIAWLIVVDGDKPPTTPTVQPVVGVRRHSRAGGYWPTEPYRRGQS